MLGNLECLSSAVFFSKSKFSFDTTSVSNRLDPDQARHYVWPVLDPNC